MALLIANQITGVRYVTRDQEEHLASIIQRGCEALDSTGTTAPSCRISKCLLLDFINVARASLSGAA